MGIRVLNPVKNGARVISYECLGEDGKPITIPKERIIELINDKKVDNARIQNYKGTIIIRINDESGAKKAGREAEGEAGTEADGTNAIDLIRGIGEEFPVHSIAVYMQAFLSKHPIYRDMVLDSEQYAERAELMKLASNFWKLVADKELKDAIYKFDKQAEDLEYKQYCKDNGIEYSQED